MVMEIRRDDPFDRPGTEGRKIQERGIKTSSLEIEYTHTVPAIDFATSAKQTVPQENRFFNLLN